MSNRIIVNHENYFQQYSVGVVFDIDGKRFIERHTIEAVELEPGLYADPSFRLTHDEAQQLMDELWRNGVRPRNGEGSNAQVEALKYHLEDMRKLVFVVAGNE